MEVIKATPEHLTAFAQEIPELAWATGPISYEYHFGTRELFDALVLGSWETENSLFGADATHLALEGDELMGIEIGMAGNEFKARQNGLAPVWQKLVANNQIDEADILGVVERSEHASWLNPVIDQYTYYIHAISVKPGYRGKRVGFHLIDAAIERAQDAGFKKFQLDVLSDNPAVDFYRAVGLELLAETRAPKPEAFGIPAEYRMGMKL
jgi:ribosomal protein S18 acetylase RimI-like enzyme